MIGSTHHLCLRLSAVSNLCSSTRFYRRQTLKPNPGVHRRLKLISEDEPDLEKANIDYKSIEELEQDFMKADHMHDEIISKMKSISKAQQFRITERKHFKAPKEPHMLTWSEKEQIRFLHQTDPEKWTFEKLADGFPASPDIIKKVVKNNWKPLTAERLKDHDQKVSKNWVAFHKGQLEVHDPRLRAHLAKFTDRKDGVRIVTDEEAVKSTEVTLQKPKRTEFLSLVTSFKPQNSSESRETKKELLLEGNSQSAKSASSLGVIDSSQANYTLDQFRRRLKEQVVNIPEAADEIKAIVGRRESDVSMDDGLSQDRYVAPSERFKVDAIVTQRQKKSHLKLIDPNNLQYRIRIPKDKWKPGLVYRVNDSFYDDSGCFMYRVPGLKT